jgi:hypothetical protein
LIKLEPNDSLLREQCGQASLGLHQWGRAELELAEATRSNARVADGAHVELWVARQMLGHRTEADEALRAFAIGPHASDVSPETRYVMDVALGTEADHGEVRLPAYLYAASALIRALRQAQSGTFAAAVKEAENVANSKDRTWRTQSRARS